MATDVIDGYLARRLDVISSNGAYFDIVSDFIFVVAGFSAFIINGIYPFWILIIIFFMFLQFIVTSKFQVPIYDPVGKYYGAFLFLTIFIGLIINNPFINLILTILIVIFTIISITSRYFHIFKNKKLKDSFLDLSYPVEFIS